jgi:hypothetical protein
MILVFRKTFDKNIIRMILFGVKQRQFGSRRGCKKKENI